MTAYKLEQQFDRRREHYWRLERLFVGEVVLSKVDARCEAQEAKHDPLRKSRIVIAKKLEISSLNP